MNRTRIQAFSGPVARDIKRIKGAVEELTYVNMGATAVGCINADVLTM